MRIRALCALALVVPATLGLSGVAHAGGNYDPEVLSTQVFFCTENTLVVSVDGAKPNSTVRIRVNWDNDGDIEIDEEVATDATGSLDREYAIPDESAVFSVRLTGVVDPNPADPDVFPFDNTLQGDRSNCPDLPNTGSDSFPIGKTALFVTLAGALLAVVAIRRRSRDEESVGTRTA